MTEHIDLPKTTKMNAVPPSKPAGGKLPASALHHTETVPQSTNPVAASPREKLQMTLEQWWLDQAHTELNALIPKAIEYGGSSRDKGLISIGRSMVDAGFPVPKFENEQVESEYLAELGVYFYMTGKMARWGAALRQGQFVSDDTVYDLGIYARMVQRIRDTGGWPV